MCIKLQQTTSNSHTTIQDCIQDFLPPITFTISDKTSMNCFGQCIAKLLTNQSVMPVILLYGEVGSGKTTFTCGLVQHFPHSEYAEISSPSFTICNYYPTSPAIIHCDLYRCSHTIPDEIYELFEDYQGLLIIEWAEYLPEKLLPTERLIFSLSLGRGNVRQVSCYHHGTITAKLMSSLIQNQQAIQQGLMDLPEDIPVTL